MTTDTKMLTEGTDGPISETPSAVSPVARCRHVQLTAMLTLCAVLVTILVFDFELIPDLLTIRADILLALPFIQILGAVVIWRLTGLPQTTGAWCTVFLLHLVLCASTVLLHTGNRHWAWIQGVALLLRVTVACGWLSVAVGGAVLLETIRRQKLRWQPWIPRALRICFACAVVIIPLELTARSIENSRRQKLPFPEHLKTSDAVHIATIGGSTMLGFPYEPHYGIGRVVLWQLRQMFPNQEFVLDNLALTGINLEQAIARLNEPGVLPDIVVVYSGHNEFFHHMEELAIARKSSWGNVDRLFRWSSLFRVLDSIVAQYSMGVSRDGDIRDRLCGMKISPDYLLERRVQRYRRQLEQLFQWADASGVSVVYCSPAACEADFEPCSSVPSSHSEQSRRYIQAQWEKIKGHQKQEQWEEACVICRQGLELHPNFAEFHFQLGKSLQKLEKTDEATTHFRRAMDEDQWPIRCLTSYRKAGLRVAREHDLPALDSAEFLRRHSTTGYLDNKQFLDGVHPNLGTTYLIGRAVTDLIVQHELLKKSEPPSTPQRTSFQESTEDLGVNTAVLKKAYKTTSGVLHHYATFRSFDMADRVTRAEMFRKFSEGLSNGELQPGQDGTESLVETVPYLGLTPSSD